MGPRVDLDDVENRNILRIPEIDLLTLGRQVCNQLKYRLSYPGSPQSKYLHLFFKEVRNCTHAFRPSSISSPQ
jgi:hypothetical protein